MKDTSQNLISKKINGDTLLQIKDGRILSYYFRKGTVLTLYDHKSFNEIFNIKLFELIEKSENEAKTNEKKGDEDEDDDDDEDGYWKSSLKYERRKSISEKCTVKEISDDSLLVGATQYLIELKLHEKTYDFKIIKKFGECILDINELADKRIIIITNNYIYVMNKENNEYTMKDINPIMQNWRIEAVSSRERFYGKFHQYFTSYVLPNNRLLLNSFSTELSYHGGCGTHPPQEFSHSKIVFIDLNKFKEIKSTNEFKVDAKNIILENVIIVQAYYDIFIYDINSLNITKQMNLKNYYNYVYKYDSHHIIAISEYENENNILVYKVENNDLIEKCEIKTAFNFKEVIGWNGYSIRGYENKKLLVLNDKRIIMICHETIYILSLEID